MIYGITIGTFYRPQRSCGQGYIFKPVCHSVHRAAGSASVHAGMPPHTPPGADTLPPDQTPPEQTPPPQAEPPPPEQTLSPPADTPQTRHPPGADPPPGKQTPAYGLRAAGTHPTGMHSCLKWKQM